MDNDEILKELAQYLTTLPEEEFDKLLKEAWEKQYTPPRKDENYNKIARLLGTMMDLCESSMEILDSDEEGKLDKLKWKMQGMASCMEDIYNELEAKSGT